jgi:hypothetical protein
VRFKSLSALKRPKPQEIALADLPQKVTIAHYARLKAYKINELVRKIHGDSFEWYGYTLAKSHTPELIEDIGLPKNDQNLQDYTTIGPARIAEFQEVLSEQTIINGWIHSHGALNYRHFSKTDEENHLTMLNFVAARLRKPVAKREIAIQDFVMLVKGQYENKDLEKGSVCFITDVPVTKATIMETVYGNFCYGIVIGDEGWHEQVIYYQERGILSGHTTVSSKQADIVFVDTGRSLTQSDISSLSDEVEVKIQPNTDPPPEMIERM